MQELLERISERRAVLGVIGQGYVPEVVGGVNLAPAHHAAVLARRDAIVDPTVQDAFGKPEAHVVEARNAVAPPSPRGGGPGIARA